MSAPTFDLPVTAGATSESALEGAVQEVVDALYVDIGERPLSEVPLAMRPGTAPDGFAGAVSGLATALAAAPGDAVTTSEGTARRLTASGVLAQRAALPLEPGRNYILRVRYRRGEDPADPSGHTVRVAIAWVDQYGNQLAGGDAFDVVDDQASWSVSDGLKTVSATLSRASGQDVQAPALARGWRPYVQKYGEDGPVDVEVIAWADVTDAGAMLSPDVTALDARVTTIEGFDANTRLSALESAVGTPDTVRFALQSDLVAATIGGTIDFAEVVETGRRYERAGSASTDSLTSNSGTVHWAPIDVATVYVSDYADGATAAARAYARGLRLHVGAGETAVLACDPSAGDDIQAMSDWYRTCSKHETATFYIGLAAGGDAVNTYIDATGPGLPLDIRGTDLPDEIEITSISYALGPELLKEDGDPEEPADLLQTYRVTITLGAAVPAAYAAGDPFGVQMPVGDNDAAACAGGQILQSIAGDRLSATFDIFSAKGLPVDPTTLTAGDTVDVTNNRAVFPKSWLRATAAGWGTGLQREGFINALDGGRVRLVNLGIAFVGDSGWEGSDHDLLFATDAGSRVYMERVVAAGAGDKVLRGFQGGEFRANNCWIGGAGKADELYQGVAGGGVSFVRTTLGGARVRGVTAGSKAHVQSSGAMLASCSDGVTVTGAGASAAWRASQIHNCQNGVRQTNGIVELDNSADSVIARCTNGLRRSEASGEVIGTPNFSGNGTNDSLQSAHPGLNIGGTATKNRLDYFESGTYTPTLFNTTNVASSTAAVTKVLRIGTTVVVSGEVTIDPTTEVLTPLTELGISLPHAADITNARDISGIAVCDQSATQTAGAAIRGDVSNDRAVLRFHASDPASRIWTFRFEYKVA